MGIKWTEKEIDFIRANYTNLSWSEIAVTLDKSIMAVKQKARKLGIRKRLPISKKELSKISTMYPFHSTADVAKAVGRTVCTINGVASRMGLKKDPVYLERKLRECGETLRDSGKSNRFPKGHVPANKGLRRPGWSAGNMKATQFKKGQRPKNWRPVGSTRVNVDGYVEVKIAEGLFQWRLLHAVNWEKAFGPIPEGMNVIFKDENKLNCEPANLEMITDAELMSRNTFQNYPEPLKQQIHILAGFKRRLNNYAKKQNRRSSKHAVRDDGTAS